MPASDHLQPQQFMHRGVLLHMPNDRAQRALYGESPEDRLSAVVEHLTAPSSSAGRSFESHDRQGSSGRAGTHWSTEPGVAQGYGRAHDMPPPFDLATKRAKDQQYGFEPPVGVIMHAEEPTRGQQMTSARALRQEDSDIPQEKEVRMRKKSAVKVTGLTITGAYGLDAPTFHPVNLRLKA